MADDTYWAGVDAAGPSDDSDALLAEVEALRRWKAEAMPVLDGLQELGRALGLPLGTQVTGPAAVERARALAAYARMPETRCTHMFPDGTPCSLSEAAHRETPGLAKVHGWPEPRCVCLDRGSRACGGGFCDPACEVCT